MKIWKAILLWAILALALLAPGCVPPTPDPSIAPPQQIHYQRPPAPQPLQVLSSERLVIKPDSRFPPPDYGKAIALGDDLLAVGAPSITAGSEFSISGSVYVYRREADGWVQDSRLQAGDQDDGFQYAQHFGSSLALQGRRLFVGAPAADDPQAGDNTGAVYIFERGADGWQETGILKSPQPTSGAEFGAMISADGENLGVMEGNRYQGGRLYLFQVQDGAWHQTAMIEVPLGEGERGGVASFDLFGDTLAVSVHIYRGEEINMTVSGEVRLYTFDGKTWVQSETLPSDIYGMSLALDGEEGAADRLAVANQMNALNGYTSGAVFVFHLSNEGWNLEEVLGSPDGDNSMYWGSGYAGAVALQGDLLLVGGPGFSEDSFWDGAAYLYQFQSGRWFDQLRLHHSEDGGFGDFFGSDVAVYNHTLLISAPNEFGNAVYVFEVGER